MKLVDVGGRRLAVWTRGAGQPAVVFETGLGATAAEWAPVQDAVSERASTVRYDRANCGESDAAEKPRSSLDMARDLHAMLHAAEVPAPYVLVAHSFGGPICLTYARHYLDEVAGLVLADATHPEQFDTFAAALPDFLAEMKQFWSTGWRSTTSTPEGVDFLTSFEQLSDLPPLGDRPLMILTSTTWNIAGPEAVQWQERWERMQRGWLTLSRVAEQRTVPDTDHFLQRGAPAAITEGVLWVLDRIA